ncbi:PARP catalytic domain-containing protein [Trichostrongylus colubriformis]|uniref:Poly [ADP-ribose] polymerase n=1 Tax=Trichostrongylus colubriformis TaxID=6319 RepID=A0AAN8FEZ3_TRICO
MLLCRVALGKCYSLNSWNYNWGDEMPKGYDSIHVVGQKHPLSSITENGVVMPLADFVDRSSRCYGGLEFSEYVVRNSNRILPQYLVIYQ